MKITSQFGTGMGFAVVALAISIAPARANSFQDIMGNYFTRNSNNVYTGSAIQNNNSPAIMANLDAKRSSLRQSINNAQASRTISSSQAAELSSELDTIDARENRDAVSNGFGYAETQSLVNALGAVDTRLQQLIASSNVTYGAQTNTYYRAGSLETSTIRNRIRSLSDRISRELNDGDISSQEADNLNFRVNSLKQQIPFGMRRNRDGLSDLQIQSKLGSIEARLAYDLQNRNDINPGYGNHHNHDDNGHHGWNHHNDNENN